MSNSTLKVLITNAADILILCVCVFFCFVLFVFFRDIRHDISCESTVFVLKSLIFSEK